MQLVLASTSKYRRELLARLGLPFEVASPGVDETPLPGEAPQDTALRLSIAKARAVSDNYPHALVIGSDQVAVLDSDRLDKPGNHARARAQLRAMRGKVVVFHTGLCVHHAAAGRSEARVIPYSVRFRNYSDAQIETYLEREQPYDCAGSAKSEGLGIALIAKMRGDDPNALVGLPLIALIEMLAAHGMQVV